MIFVGSWGMRIWRANLWKKPAFDKTLPKTLQIFSGNWKAPFFWSASPPPRTQETNKNRICPDKQLFSYFTLSFSIPFSLSLFFTISLSLSLSFFLAFFVFFLAFFFAFFLASVMFFFVFFLLLLSFLALLLQKSNTTRNNLKGYRPDIKFLSQHLYTYSIHWVTLSNINCSTWLTKWISNGSFKSPPPCRLKFFRFQDWGLQCIIFVQAWKCKLRPPTQQLINLQ